MVGHSVVHPAVIEVEALETAGAPIIAAAIPQGHVDAGDKVFGDAVLGRGPVDEERILAKHERQLFVVVAKVRVEEVRGSARTQRIGKSRRHQIHDVTRILRGGVDLNYGYVPDGHAHRANRQNIADGGEPVYPERNGRGRNVHRRATVAAVEIDRESKAQEELAHRP